MNNPLIEQFGQEVRWVNWKLLTVKGKQTKVPFFKKNTPASSTDPATWKTYDDATDDLNNGSNGFSGVGFVFKEDSLVLGVDIDHCLEDGIVNHEQKMIIESFIAEAKTYCEISPSNTGLHLYFKLTEAFSPVTNKKAPYELYSHGRYFTFTGNQFRKSLPVREVTPKEMTALLSKLGYPWNKTEKTHNSVDVSTVESNTDENLFKKMFSAKNGENIKKLYDGDITAYKGDASSADMAFCNTLAFWTAKNPVQMERMWLSSPLGEREKTQKRKDYREMTIGAAIINCKDVYESFYTKVTKEAPELDLLFTLNDKKDKVITQNTENICRVIRGHAEFAGVFRYDVFKNTLERFVNKSPRNQTPRWRGLEDNDAVDIQTRIQILFPCFNKVGKDMVYDAIIKVSKENTVDSASDFITAIKWDGKERLNTWLTQTYGVKDDAYHQTVGSNWMKGLVKRIIEPGCKFDYVLVLEGEQGTKKSTSLGVLGRDWHVETTMSTDNKDFFMQFSGKAIIEFSEGETLSRTEVKRMKAIITMQTDKYRPPYERTSQDFPRRCVFAMTTNQTEYLKDETGNRRWLPVTVVLPEANVEWLAVNRDQLFAEAYHRAIILKETLYEFPKEEMITAQNARRVTDPNADTIAMWYHGKLTQAQRDNGITVEQVYRDAINKGFSPKPIDKFNEMNIADTLKTVLKLEKRRRLRENARVTVWLDKDHLEEVEPLDVKSEAEKILEKMESSF